MTTGERRASLALAGLFSLRMLGLFMILPVFSLYAGHFSGSTPVLVGLAIGAYGLTQALFQVPFGLLSDRIGRKPVIAAGLLIFALGSVVAALADSIYMVILGRALQGSGAIAATVMALAADVTREEHRSKAMAIIGMSIGLAFGVALLAGPVLNGFIGISGIFWLTAGLALLGLLILATVPRPVDSRQHRDTELVIPLVGDVLRRPQLLRLDAGILILHMMMTAMFVVLPLMLRDFGNLPDNHHWWVYLPVLLLSFLAMVPFLILAEKKRQVRGFFLTAIGLLLLAQLGLSLWYNDFTAILVCIFVYFAAFNYLEASLPALVTRLAPADKKGTALGVYSSSQFMGAFLGGAAGGAMYGALGFAAVFGLMAAMAALWLVLAWGMSNPKAVSSYVVRVGKISAQQASELSRQLGALQGVSEAVVLVEDGTAYLKVDRKTVDKDAVQATVAAIQAG